jgi:diguanylate cyclase (GGDEF)-like protein
MHIDAKHINHLYDIIGSYRHLTDERFSPFLTSSVDGFRPPALSSVLRRCDELQRVIDGIRPSGGEIPDSFRPLLRTAAAAIRRRIANDIERRREQVLHKELLDKLDDRLKPYDEIMALESLQMAEPEAELRLTDFFPIKVLETSAKRSVFPARDYDEKFHILQAPTLFLQDLEWTREASALRDVTFAVAYLDIDNFGAFNKTHTEPIVDRLVLPKLMRRIEAHVFMRGQAYRKGGDEYCLILNNVAKEEALDAMDSLRMSIESLEYDDITQRTTVSIGVVVVAPSCHLTGHEIEHVTATAKAFAKDHGRNRIATFQSQIYEKEQLYIARPRLG